MQNDDVDETPQVKRQKPAEHLSSIAHRAMEEGTAHIKAWESRLVSG